MRESPIESLTVDVSASITNFIICMEVSRFISCCELNWLARHQLSLSFKSSDWYWSSIKFIETIIEVFRNRNSFEYTSLMAITLCINLWQMNRSHCPNLMEIIYCINFPIHRSTHCWLSMLHPRRSFQALRTVRVN